jgi:hypothetical protein
MLECMSPKGAEGWIYVATPRSSGIQDSSGHVHRREMGTFNAKASNVEFPASLCVRQGLSLVVGLVDGWTFPAGGRNLDMV